jgi:hypothetical protein
MIQEHLWIHINLRKLINRIQVMLFPFDQYISSVPGRLVTSKGKERKDNQFCGGTLFIDHATKYMYLRHQVTLNAGDNVRPTHRFENHTRDHGVKVASYCADNVPFSTFF